MSVREQLDRLDKLRAEGAPEGGWTAERMFWKLGSTRGTEDGWWQHITDDAGTVALLSEVDDDEHDTAANRAALIVESVNSLGKHTAALRAVLELADLWDAAAELPGMDEDETDQARNTAALIRDAITKALDCP